MSAGIFGNSGPQIGNMLYRGLFDPEEFTNGQEVNSFDSGSQPSVTGPVQPMPGYQQMPETQQPQSSGSQQYYQQMRQNLDGLSEAFKQLEQMQSSGGQYNPGPGMPNFGPAMFGGGGK